MNDTATDDEGGGNVDERWPWFVFRMMSDEWSFGLYLTDGSLLGCTHLNSVKVLNGETWLDVELMDRQDVESQKTIWHTIVRGAPTSRTTASINARHVMYVVELADT